MVCSQARMRRNSMWAIGWAGALALAAAGTAHAAPQISYSGSVTAAYYSDYVDTATSIDFEGTPFQTDTIASVSELRDYYGQADSDPNWPGGGTVFATDFTGDFDAPQAGTYQVLIGLDDGGNFFVNGTQYFSETGPNSVSFTLLSIPMAAGLNTFELQYYNAQPSGAIAYLGLNGAYPAIPEPATWTMLIGGVGAIGAFARRRRSAPKPLAVPA